MTAGEIAVGAVIAGLAAGLMLALMPAVARGLRLHRRNFAGEAVCTARSMTSPANRESRLGRGCPPAK